MRDGRAPADIVEVIADACRTLRIDPSELSRSTYPRIAYALELHSFDDAVDIIERNQAKREAEQRRSAARGRLRDDALNKGWC